MTASVTAPRLKFVGVSAAVLAVVTLVTGAAAPSNGQRISALESQVAALTARVSALEGKPSPSPAPTPTPVPTLITLAPPATPTITLAPTSAPAPVDWQAAVNAAAPGAVLDFTGTIYTKALTISKPLTVTLGELDGKNAVSTCVTVTGTDVTIKGGRIHDCTYAGVMLLSVSRAKVQGVTVQRIAKAAYDAAVAGGPPMPNSMNAYGIAVSQTSGPVSQDVEISGNTIEDVPSWEGIDAHGGINITINDNVIRRTNRAIRVIDPGGKRPKNIAVNRNLAVEPTPRPDVLHTYPYNEVAFSLFNIDGVSGTGNRALGWPTALDTSGSTAVTVTVATT